MVSTLQPVRRDSLLMVITGGGVSIRDPHPSVIEKSLNL
jgi:hypothetical protein